MILLYTENWTKKINRISH